MKKTMSLFLSILLVSMVFSACVPSQTPQTPSSENNNENSQSSETTASDAGANTSGKITVWAWDPNFNIAIMKEAAQRYQANNPNVEFEIVEMAKADVEQKLHTTLASKASDGLPDIVLIEDYNAQKYLTSYPGMFTDVSSHFDFSKFTPYKVDVSNLDGKQYGIPFDSGVAGFFYRKDILEEAGFTPDDLNNITWDRFIEIGKTVKEKTGKYFMSFDKVDGGIMRIMMQSAGEWYFDAEGNSQIKTSPAIREALDYYKKIVEADIAKPSNGWNEWVGAFNTGEASSVTTGIWIIGSIKAAEDQSGKWALAPVPRLNYEKSTNTSNLGGSTWFLPVGSPNSEAALEFMKTIYGGDNEFYQAILTNNGAMGSYIPAFEGDAYNIEDEFFGGSKIYADLSKWATKVPSVNYGMYTYEADAALMAQVDAYIGGSVTLDEALAAADAQLSSQIQ